MLVALTLTLPTQASSNGNGGGPHPVLNVKVNLLNCCWRQADMIDIGLTHLLVDDSAGLAQTL